MAKPTIHDVARLAQVSIKTVSRVTNGDSYVAADTAERVRRAIEELGYQGLWVSAGHFRTGAKEAPATAMLVAEALATGETPPLLAAFAPAAQEASA